jgi:Zn-dependent protease with chaperone function
MLRGKTGAARAAGAILLVFALPFTALADRTRLKPGWNLFSPQDDITLGKKAAADAAKQLPMCNDAKVDGYLTQLGQRLVKAAGEGAAGYPWEFHCVNDRAINAFALPGGYVFVNRGAIEAADNESQLAGVIAHELSHVILRHGTNQASKAQGLQLGLGALGAVLGGGTRATIIEQLASFSAGSVLLKYSRTAETQADVMGTQILYDAGYDPRGMTQFFEKIQAESKGGRPPEFFSDHPNPENRVARVNDEIDRLGGIPRNARRDSPDFQAAKREVMSLPVVKAKTPGAAAGKPAKPSGKFSAYSGSAFSMKYPDNWQKSEGENAVSFAPEGGIVQDRNGKAAMAYGMLINMADTPVDPKSANALEAATEHLIDQLQHANPGMSVLRKSERVRLNGERALSTYLKNDSPAGGQETDWLITVVRPDGLLFFVCVAPEPEYPEYDRTFEVMLDSVRFNR